MTGNRAEKLFIDSFPDPKIVVLPTREQDMFEHWDCMINGDKYDVKSRKKLHKRDKDFIEDIHVELINVRGNTGWIRGKADYFAFEQEHDFLIVPREPLYLMVVNKLTLTHGFGYYQQYGRRGRKDLVTLVPKTDILTLPCKLIKKVCQDQM